MKQLLNKKQQLFVAVLFGLSLTGCKKDGNPNNLPDVSPTGYEGTIDGYTSSDEVMASKQIAYWNFESLNETVSGTAPSTSANATIVGGGVKGQALNLAAGYVLYTAQLPKFKTDSLKSWSISTWVKILNNGSKRTMLFQLARPGIFNGNINFALNTNSFPASNVDVLRIQPTFTTIGGGTQDNINSTLSPRIGLDKWTHIMLTYDGNTGVFLIWGDGVNIGSFNNRGVGNNLFKSWEPNQVIIGSNYNGIPGMAVNADVSFAPMTGLVDEIRVYNATLGDAYVKALYKLGQAGK